MEVTDFYCGSGGMSAGAILAGCTVTHGIDMNSSALRHWAANTAGRAVCRKISPDSSTKLPWPRPSPHTHVHLSPPCTMLSKARAGRTTADEARGGISEMAESIAMVIDKGYASFSIENVSTPLTVQLAQCAKEKFSDKLDFLTLNANEYGTPSDRIRLLLACPGIIQRLKEMPVRRVSVRRAFELAGVELPADYIKNNTRTRKGQPCVRSVEDCSQTVVGSHPLTWCKRDGTTVRCLSVRESAILMGFPEDWKLPSGQRAGMLAVGNAIPPPLARAIMEAAIAAAAAHESDAQ